MPTREECLADLADYLIEVTTEHSEAVLAAA